MGVASKAMSRIPPGAMVPLIAWQYRFFEPELRRLEEFVPKDRGAVDVGVWWGPWSWWLARHAVRVDSFEANEQLANTLQKVLPANVHLHQVALSDHKGDAKLWVPAGGTGTEGRASIEPDWSSTAGGSYQVVPTQRLDDFALEDVGFLKVDVEGHELAVLKGATELLTSQRPMIMIEIEERSHGDGYFDSIVEFLGDYSYTGQYLQNGRWHPIEEFDRNAALEMAAHLAKHGYVTNMLFYVRRYVHNFLFSPH
jgi:FkbM family methyltransferase